MQIQISADEVFTEYQNLVATLNHDLMLERMKNRKLAEIIEQHERAEANRVQEALKKRGEPVTTAPETYPAVPAPPAPPSASGERSGAMGDHTV